MSQESRFLVTTALEETWVFDRSVLFLGEWTRLHDRRKVWQGMDAVVAAPVGMDLAQRKRDFEFLQALADRLLQELAASLDTEHGIHFGERYWRIALGHWLSRYLCLAYNRYRTIERALAEHHVISTAVLDFEAYTLATRDSLSFLWASNDKVWNHVFYARVLKHLGGPAPELRAPVQQVTSYAMPEDASRAKSGLRRRLLSHARDLLPKLSRESDAFIQNTHLSRLDEVLLQLSLGQVPQLWLSPRPVDASVDTKRREHLIVVSGSDDFERFSRALLRETLPTCYLEGYRVLHTAVKALPWPTRPKFIYTSNSFDVDEGFKLWTAAKVMEGSAYFAGQHGAGYGSHLYMQTKYAPELTASDAFLTWGWSDGTRKTVPAFMFNAAGLKPRRSIQSGGLLLVEASMLNQITHWDNYYEFGLYQDEQFRFAAALPDHIRRQLTVRLHSSHSKFEWAEVQRWKEQDPDIFIDTGSVSIGRQMEKSRLIVYAYDSTGILECLRLNIPVLCFWRNGLSHLSAEAQAYYGQLIDAGILVSGPEALAERVIEVWEDIGKWWNSPKVQTARGQFCDQFARSSAHPVRDLRALLDTLMIARQIRDEQVIGEATTMPNVKDVRDIYRDGTYLRSNPTLHSEDSEYKFCYIKCLLDGCNFSGTTLRVLDIGGGAGTIAALVCRHLAKRGLHVECHAFDLSVEMLELQRANNPYNTFVTSSFAEICEQRYDLVLLIDVIEHIQDNGPVADDVDRIARHMIYNIPIERNLFDWLRNIYMNREYYAMQTASLGHVHFFSYRSAKRFARAHHRLVSWISPDYPGHLLESEFYDYVMQRANRLRRLELVISRFIFRHLSLMAPWLIQGSLFMLTKSRTLSE
ncbi:MAG: methyltransferase domain-containing protein [Rhodocyclaceae bacterium]|nr:methyltransferase domain-containing protein [Rhodocyclaceae bacterium]